MKCIRICRQLICDTKFFMIKLIAIQTFMFSNVI
jgi:hypothetical protein